MTSPRKLAQGRAHYQRNRTKILERKRRYYQQRRDVILARQARYRAAHGELIRESEFLAIPLAELRQAVEADQS